MRTVVQRVSRASVKVVTEEATTQVASIRQGLLLLVGVKRDDSDEDARSLAQKVAQLRVMDDNAGKLNLSLLETGGEALVVSNFTLYGDCRKGRRPSFLDAASGEQAETLYLAFGRAIAAEGITVQYGVFGAQMEVDLVNDGPITLLLDSRKQF